MKLIMKLLFVINGCKLYGVMSITAVFAAVHDAPPSVQVEMATKADLRNY